MVQILIFCLFLNFGRRLCIGGEGVRVKSADDVARNRDRFISYRSNSILRFFITFSTNMT